ncbi:hypothetical protein F2P79_017714 [Pimephales promelas]|nr:hypothetical protein F2P79_017714 [Pimephales promelas]
MPGWTISGILAGYVIGAGSTKDSRRDALDSCRFHSESDAGRGILGAAVCGIFFLVWDPKIKDTSTAEVAAGVHVCSAHPKSRDSHRQGSNSHNGSHISGCCGLVRF